MRLMSSIPQPTLTAIRRRLNAVEVAQRLRPGGRPLVAHAEQSAGYIPKRVELLLALYTSEEPGHVSFWRRSDKKTYWIPAHRLEDAARIKSDQDVYFKVALHDQTEARRTSENDDPDYDRASTGNAVALGGLGAVFDVHGPTSEAGR